MSHWSWLSGYSLSSGFTIGDEIKKKKKNREKREGSKEVLLYEVIVFETPQNPTSLMASGCWTRTLEVSGIQCPLMNTFSTSLHTCMFAEAVIASSTTST